MTTCKSDTCHIQSQNEELRRQIEIRDIALNSARVMIRIINPTGANIFGNVAEVIQGHTADEEGKNLLSVVDLVHPDDQNRLLDFFFSTFSQTGRDETEPFKYRYLTTDGRYQWVKAIGRLVRQAGRPAFAVYTVWDVTESKEMEDQLHALAERLHTIREEERTRVSREIHDEFGQALTGLKFELAMLFKQIPPKNSEAVEKARNMMASIDQTIQLVRKISTDLRPPILDDFGLTDAIEWQAEDFEKKTGITTRLSAELPATVMIDKEKGISIFRIFQEALTNVARHAEADAVEIGIRHHDGLFSMQIKDSGRGITDDEIKSKDSLGIMGMKERAFALGGTFIIQAANGRGTLIKFTMPLQPDNHL